MIYKLLSYLGIVVGVAGAVAFVLAMLRIVEKARDLRALGVVAFFVGLFLFLWADDKAAANEDVSEEEVEAMMKKMEEEEKGESGQE